MKKNLIIGFTLISSLSTFIYFGFSETYSTITACVYTQEKYVNAVFEEDTTCNGTDEDGETYTYDCTETTKNKISDSFLSSTVNGELVSLNFSNELVKASPNGYYYTDEFPYFPNSFESHVDFYDYEFINNEQVKVHFKTKENKEGSVSESIDKYGKCLTDVKEKTLMKTKYFYSISYSVENAI